MNKEPRTDKKKNIGKVAKVLIENPQATVREIAKEVGLGSSTVQRAKEEVAQSGTKDPIIAYIVESSKKNLQNISKANLAMTKAIIREYLDYDEELDEYSLKQGKHIGEIVHYLNKITAISKDDLTRITVLGGDVTDMNGGLKVLSIEDLVD